MAVYPVVQHSSAMSLQWPKNNVNLENNPDILCTWIIGCSAYDFLVLFIPLLYMAICIVLFILGSLQQVGPLQM